jgi:hypothetical protein
MASEACIGDDGSCASYAVGHGLEGMRQVQMVVEGMLCMLEALKSMQYILLVVVKFVLCKLDVL